KQGRGAPGVIGQVASRLPVRKDTDMQKVIVWFSEVARKDIATVGGKGANLGEMTSAHIPVPPG
ncbi:unnamed protein product, partial [marine sediment metagenome]